MSYLSEQELTGFASVGKDVLISSKATLYNRANIRIGDRVRIDDFCVLSAGEGGIHLGSNIHLAPGVSVRGKGRVTISDFCGLSDGVKVYSSSDDYSGESLTNPTVPEKYKSVHHGDVFLGKHVIVGAGSVLLPGVTVNEGAAIGSLSLVRADCEAWKVYFGAPIRRVGERSRRVLQLEEEYLEALRATTV